jgi:protein SCO1/2
VDTVSVHVAQELFMANLMVLQRQNSGCSVRTAIYRIFAAGLFTALLMVGSEAKAWNSTDMTGALPSLDFTMTRASDGKTVTSADFKGKVVLLYFGYTFCPDVCPTTLLDIATMLKTLGKVADDVRVLFVTVDPGRDTLPVLKTYTAAFAPQVVGLRGTSDQLTTLAKRYRVAYSVEPASNGNPPEVTHGTAVYVFDRNGAIRLLFTGLAEPNAKLTGMTADLRRLVLQSGHVSLWRWIENAL